jgi:hypothetical protein
MLGSPELVAALHRLLTAGEDIEAESGRVHLAECRAKSIAAGFGQNTAALPSAISGWAIGQPGCHAMVMSSPLMPISRLMKRNPRLPTRTYPAARCGAQGAPRHNLSKQASAGRGHGEVGWRVGTLEHPSQPLWFYALETTQVYVPLYLRLIITHRSP